MTKHLFTLFLLFFFGSGISQVDSRQDVTMHGVNQEAYREDFPFIAENTRSPGCVSVVVAKKWVLTTDPCAVSTENMEVRVGANTRGAGTAHLAEKKELNNGLALFKISGNGFDFSNKSVVAPVKLPKRPTPKDRFSIGGAKGVTVGWGILAATEKKLFTDLLSTWLFVLRDGKCNAMVKSAIENKYLSTDKYAPTDYLCAVDPHKGSISLCNSDGGNPFIVDGVLQGIFWSSTADRSLKCPNRNKIVFFTKISSYVDWITSIIDDKPQKRAKPTTPTPKTTIDP